MVYQPIVFFELKLVTALRLSTLSVMLYITSQVSLFGTTHLLIQYMILYAGFILALFVTGEIGPDDWTVLKRMIKPRMQT